MALPEWQKELMRSYLVEEWTPPLNYAKTRAAIEEQISYIEMDIGDQIDGLEFTPEEETEVWTIVRTFYQPWLDRLEADQGAVIPRIRHEVRKTGKAGRFVLAAGLFALATAGTFWAADQLI